MKVCPGPGQNALQDPGRSGTAPSGVSRPGSRLVPGAALRASMRGPGLSTSRANKEEQSTADSYVWSRSLQEAEC